MIFGDGLSLILLLGCPERAEGLGEAWSAKIKLEHAHEGDNGGTEESNSRRGAQCLGNVIADDVVEGDVRVDGEEHTESKVDGKIEPRREHKGDGGQGSQNKKAGVVDFVRGLACVRIQQAVFARRRQCLAIDRILVVLPPCNNSARENLGAPCCQHFLSILP